MRVTYLLLALVVAISQAATLSSQLQDQSTRKGLNALGSLFGKQEGVDNMSVDCALCGIAINEVEGLLIEEKTQEEIENYLEATFCTGSSWETVCDLLVSELPTIISSIESRNSVSTVCVEMGICSYPFPTYTDPVPVPTFVINLDLPPQQRLKEVCGNVVFKEMGQYLVNTIGGVLGNFTENKLGDIGSDLNDYYFPTEFAQEIKGCAEVMGIPYGWLSLLNLGYEVSDACTSIIAETPDGKILHARNLDFWAGMGFTDTLKNMTYIADYQKGGKTVFQATTFAGYVGVLSGFKDKAFSVTIDTRFLPGGVGDVFYEVIAAITETNASLVSFLTREVLENENDYPTALKYLSNTHLIADVYYILAGVSSGQGAVISRNRLNATDVWTLDKAKGRWFEVQTNYDHWKQAPWFDDRITPANNAMHAIGPNQISLDNMFKVLSTKPVFNLQTTYSILSCPADGTYKSWTRYCPYPCTE
eukprot:TRINITY_DN3375_c0_g1_i1.p1 TRINITY_DN3375_c0_g1~~TRINITY_DN3375_c0_g1_i1.p1  ORF type:complete len:476 (-),score=96.67 TRINITY_DN3375_c0_g1_i1:28-1455(-)